MVDAAQHEIRTLRHQRLEREHHAIGGRSIHLPAPLAALHRTKRVMQRQRVTRSTLLAVRRDDGDFAQRFSGSAEPFDSMRENAVIICYEKPQGVIPSETRDL